MANQPKKYKKFVATAATATLVASAIVPVASAASLTDIAGNTHEEAIKALVDAKVINGYADGTFKPNQTLTRSDVVKLLGKYLVSQGHSIPTDAVTNPRFNDLTSKSNKELLEYAAVVADAGVFAGSNGKLLAADQITRENMAIVLVRMINTLKDVSLEEFVGSQNFNGDVKDLNVAKAEARTAIQVLDFYDITNPSVANFNPKGNTTRGQFATFLHKTINADFSGAAATTGTVKAINATTVEVTFGEDVADIKALDFAINGLEVSNAVVKQTDKKTVVLTTSPQTAGVEYTVSVNGNEFGKFTGISAVIPTKVELVSSSVQGKLGQQVTVQAKVTVAAGQSAAGIPVTLNATSTNATLNAPQVVEATTDANGVATYTYTRYAAGNDTVVAYATGDRSKFSTGFVFWGVDTIVSIEEVTAGATINNGANKTYKVTYKNAATGLPEANKKFNVSVLENINVTADKLQNVKVNGIDVKQLSNNTIVEAAQITTDSKGEATFTLSGTNAEVTPVVFEAHSTNVSNVFTKKYEASVLQTTAAKVKFAAVQAEYNIELTRDGGEVAATGEGNGREYKVLVKDKNGNVAKNETVNVAFNEDLDRVISTNTKAGFVNPDTDKFYPVSSSGNELKQISVKTNDKGEATFIIATAEENENDYATPVAWIDINSSNAKRGALDEGEPTKVAQISHFQAAYLDGAEIKSYKAGKKETKFNDSEIAEFKAELVNQSGKVFTGGYTMGKVTYTVFNTGAEDIEVGGVVISPNRSETFTKDNGASLFVNSKDGKSSSVRVIATGIAYKGTQDFSFTAKEATATFTNSTVVAAPYTGYVNQFNTADSGTDSNSLWFVNKKPIKYTGTNVEYYGANGNQIFGEVAWENYLTSLIGSDVTVSYSKDGEKTIFKVIAVATGTANQLKATVPPTTATDGAIVFTNTSFNATASQAINVTDSDLNADKTARETTTVKVVSGDIAYTLTATETGNDTGVFTATLTTQQLAVLADGVITATYEDARNTTGSSVTRTATATLSTVAGAFTVSNSGAPIVAYSAGTPTAAKVTGAQAGTALVAGNLTIKVDNATLVVPIDASAGTITAAVAAQEVIDAINTESTNAGLGNVASLDVDKVVLTSPTTGTSSLVEVVSLGTVTGSGLSVAPATNGTIGSPAKAKWSFTLTSNVGAGEKVKVTLGSKTVELVEGTDFNAGATAALTAAALVAELDHATTGLVGYNVTNTTGSNVIVIEQDTAADDNSTLSASVTK